MTSYQEKKIRRHTIRQTTTTTKTPQFEEIEQELEQDMTGVLELSDREYETLIIQTVKS